MSINLSCYLEKRLWFIKSGSKVYVSETLPLCVQLMDVCVARLVRAHRHIPKRGTSENGLLEKHLAPK